VLLAVRNQWAEYTHIPFLVDTGADVSAIPMPLARARAIPFLRDEARRAVARGLVGAVGRYRSLLNVRIFGESFSWPCDFLDTPGPATLESYGVIGRAGFQADFAFCVEEPWLTLRRRGKFWNRFLPPWTREHPADEPL
jgi:hypothetical protein